MTESLKTGTPLWQSIATTLRRAIAEGQYPEGARLPTEAEFAARFGVNRHTVRHALKKLIEDGLVHSRRGAGTFVLAKPLDYPLSERVRFRQNLLAAGRLPGRRILSVETRASTASEAAKLELTPGDMICVMHGIALADGTPVTLSESHFPEVRLPGLAEALQTGGGVTNALKAVGVEDYIRVETRLSATNADATQAAHLRLAEGAPLLLAEALNTADGRPVEAGRTWFASDRVTLTLDHQSD